MQPQSPPQLPVDLDDADARVPLYKLVYYLISWPSIFFHLRHKTLLNTIFLILVFCTGSSLVVTLAYVPKMRQVGREFCSWFNTHVKDFRVNEDGKFVWQQPAALPFRSSFHGYQIDFNEDGKIPRDPKELSQAVHGVWVSRDRIQSWRIDFEKGPITPKKVVVVSPPLPSQLFVPLLGNRDWKIEEMTTWGMWIFGLSNFIILSLGTVITVIIPPLFTSLFFLVGTPFIRKGTRAAAVGRVLVLYLYVCIPPLIVGTLYTAFHLSFLKTRESTWSFIFFQYVFFTTYFIYHLYVMRVIQAACMPPPPRRNLNL